MPHILIEMVLQINLLHFYTASILFVKIGGARNRKEYFECLQ